MSWHPKKPRCSVSVIRRKIERKIALGLSGINTNVSKSNLDRAPDVIMPKKVIQIIESVMQSQAFKTHKRGIAVKLFEFSVSNYRSITKASKISISNMTVLVGKNNEGKSNLLTALQIAMNEVRRHSGKGPLERMIGQRNRPRYDWDTDFPMQLRSRRQKNGLESIFKLIFRLEDDELAEFQSVTHTHGNKDIPITVKIGRENKPSISVPKRGTSSYNEKAKEVTEFIADRISFNYIPAVRTEGTALEGLEDVIFNELESLQDDEEYISALDKVVSLQQKVFDRIADQLVDPLKTFLPNLKAVSIEQKDTGSHYRATHNRLLRLGADVIIDDGIPTSISKKGDGIKSLVTLAILKDKRTFGGASIIAIEEPESHLHSGAIHGLVDVINRMSEHNQVIVTTHNPLFVQQNKLSQNIIVDNGSARKAKNIIEIRDTLGIWPSDNLIGARFVVVVEGESDRVALTKLLPLYSDEINKALSNNLLAIKSIHGTGNLRHDLADLKNSMCTYIVLLDNDSAGKSAASKAMESGLLTMHEVRYACCDGMRESEFEDCLNPKIYENEIERQYGVILEHGGKKKWSDRISKFFRNQGRAWDDNVEKEVKTLVATCIPSDSSRNDLHQIVIQQKSCFLEGLARDIDSMLQSA